jgi:hypothetical protein
MKSSKQLYQCNECGSITSYHHRYVLKLRDLNVMCFFSHHTNSSMRRVTTDLDDPGYESGNR